ncbi:MAG: hypothetical protein R3E42_11970 [Burkholderiaceae bacterium]
MSLETAVDAARGLPAFRPASERQLTEAAAVMPDGNTRTVLFRAFSAHHGAG